MVALTALQLANLHSPLQVLAGRYASAIAYGGTWGHVFRL